MASGRVPKMTETRFITCKKTGPLERTLRLRQRCNSSALGWSMLDQEHPEQLNQTRGTLWEIHPIMQIEVQQNGSWVPLDSAQL